MEKCQSSTDLKIRIFIKFAQKERHMFNVWTIIMQSFNIKELKLLELQITQTRNHLSISNEKMSQVQDPPPPPPKMKKILVKCA